MKLFFQMQVIALMLCAWALASQCPTKFVVIGVSYPRLPAKLTVPKDLLNRTDWYSKHSVAASNIAARLTVIFTSQVLSVDSILRCRRTNGYKPKSQLSSEPQRLLPPNATLYGSRSLSLLWSGTALSIGTLMKLSLPLTHLQRLWGNILYHLFSCLICR